MSEWLIYTGDFERVGPDYFVPNFRDDYIEHVYVAVDDSDLSKGFRRLNTGGHYASEFGYPIYRKVSASLSKEVERDEAADIAAEIQAIAAGAYPSANNTHPEENHP
jgi:hypothetical protein